MSIHSDLMMKKKKIFCLPGLKKRSGTEKTEELFVIFPLDVVLHRLIEKCTAMFGQYGLVDKHMLL